MNTLISVMLTSIIAVMTVCSILFLVFKQKPDSREEREDRAHHQPLVLPFCRKRDRPIALRHQTN